MEVGCLELELCAVLEVGRTDVPRPQDRGLETSESVGVRLCPLDPLDPLAPLASLASR